MSREKDLWKRGLDDAELFEKPERIHQQDAYLKRQAGYYAAFAGKNLSTGLVEMHCLMAARGYSGLAKRACELILEDHNANPQQKERASVYITCNQKNLEEKTDQSDEIF